MSFLNKLLGNSSLKNAIAQTEKARKAEGEEAEKLLQAACESYAAISGKDSVMSEASYHWGLALMYLAQAKTGDDAAKFYQQAGEKFSTAVTINPQYIDALIDWGVALMGQAQASGVDPDHSLYKEAEEKFLRADTLQQGAGAYNLACIQSLRGDYDACQKYLKIASENWKLPETEEILNDSDIANAREQVWFQDFLDSLLAEEEEEVPVDEEADSEGEPKDASKT